MKHSLWTIPGRISNCCQNVKALLWSWTCSLSIQEGTLQRKLWEWLVLDGLVPIILEEALSTRYVHRCGRFSSNLLLGKGATGTVLTLLPKIKIWCMMQMFLGYKLKIIGEIRIRQEAKLSFDDIEISSHGQTTCQVSFWQQLFKAIPWQQWADA